MCIIDTSTYILKDGTERRIETTKLCQFAVDDRTCDHVERRGEVARLIETKPSDVAGPSRTSGDVLSTHDKHGRDRKYRSLSKRDGKRPVSYREDAFGDRSYSPSPVSPGSYRVVEVRPPAPSPPPTGNQYPPRSPFCPRPDCPMMTGARDAADRSPLPPTLHEDDFIRDTTEQPGPSRPRVRIITPSKIPQKVPTLSSPRPPKKPSKPGHARHDSGVALPNYGDRVGDAFGDRQSERKMQEDRDLAQQQERLFRDENRRLDFEAREQAREDARHTRYLDRQRQAQQAEQDARADDEYERRVKSEDRDKERERKEAQHKRSISAENQSPRREPVSNTSPLSPRRSTRTAIIHQERHGPVVRQPRRPDDLAHGNDIIRREQNRLRRESEGGMEDPLREDTWREWGTGKDGTKRVYYDRDRRRLD